MPTTIHLVRHAQGFHNLNHVNEGIPDPYLTPLGKQQCADLRASFPHHARLTHLVASPMRRTLLTCHLGFSSPSLSRVTALPLVQEVSTQPCDTGSEPVMLRAEFGALREDGEPAWLDDAELARGWNDKSTKYAPVPARLEARAAEARRWLRALGRRSHGVNAEIVVVTHGGFLHFLTQDWEGMEPSSGTGWANTEWRSYEFVEPEGDDEEASIRETKASWQRRRGSAIPLTETEQRQLREARYESLKAAEGQAQKTA